jgi:endonuclease G
MKTSLIPGGFAMIKRLFILLTVCILLLAACAPVASEIVVLRGAEPVSLLSPDELSAYSSEHIVYVTRTGKKYHEAGCSYLSDSSIPITLEQALLEGKEPCSRCH